MVFKKGPILFFTWCVATLISQLLIGQIWKVRTFLESTWLKLSKTVLTFNFCPFRCWDIGIRIHQVKYKTGPFLKTTLYHWKFSWIYRIHVVSLELASVSDCCSNTTNTSILWISGYYAVVAALLSGSCLWVHSFNKIHKEVRYNSIFRYGSQFPT